MINLVIFSSSLLALVVAPEVLGSWMMRRIGLETKPDTLSVAYGLGLALITEILICMGLTGIYTRPAMAGLWTILLILGAGRTAWKCKRWNVREFFQEREGELLPPWLRIGTVVMLALCLATVMTPETRHDPYDYHLTAPTLYLALGSIAEIPWHVFTYMPKNTEILYGLALGVGNDSMAKLFHFVFGCLCVLTLTQWIKKYLGTAAGWMTAFSVVSMPLFGFLATSAYVDLALAFWELLATACLLRVWDEQEGNKKTVWLGLSAFFAGMALATKYVAWMVFLLPYAGMVYYTLHRRVAPRLWTAGGMIGLGILPVLPWWITNWVWTGNPVYPLLPSIFGMHTPAAAEAYGFFRGHAPAMEMFYPENLAPYLWMRFGKLMLDGNALMLIGLVGILLQPLWKTLKTDRPIRVPAQTGIYGFIVFSGILFLLGTDNHDGRFCFATLALLAIPATQVLVALEEKMIENGNRNRLVLPLIFLVLIFNGLSYRFAQMNDLRETFIPVFSEEQHEDWLTNHFPDYPLVQWANRNLPKDSYVLGMGYPLRLNHISGNKYGTLPFAQGWTAETPMRQRLEDIKLYGITHVVVPNEILDLSRDLSSLAPDFLQPVFQYRGKTIYAIQREGQ